MSKRFFCLLATVAFAAGSQAKLPAPALDDAAKAKAAETAARAAWQAKVDAFQLCRAQDRIAAKYKSGGKATTDAKAVPVVAKPAAAASATAAAAAASAPTAAASGTPAAAAPPAPCIEPGAFAYNPPEQKPLETSGAHSPTGTAASPPSVRAEAAQMPAATPGATPAAAAATTPASAAAAKPAAAASAKKS